MPRVGFEVSISKSEGVKKIHALDCSTAAIGEASRLADVAEWYAISPYQLSGMEMTRS
jgi:hypothetical protein